MTMKSRRSPPAGLGIHLDVTNRLWRTVMDQSVLPFCLTHPHWLALSAISDLGGKGTLKDICQYLEGDTTTMSRALVFLEKNKLVTRQAMPDDKRAKVVQMTQAGEELLAVLDNHGQLARASLLQGVSASELESFRKVLDAIKKNATVFIANREQNFLQVNPGTPHPGDVSKV